VASIALREEPVPLRLPDAVIRGPLVEAARDAILLSVPGVARFLVQAGGPTLVERAPPATDADVRYFADEAVAAAVALLDGQLVLRGAAVVIGGRAVALCGPSAAGKSALAAALAQRGSSVLSDAVTVVSIDSLSGRPAVWPVASEPVLWPDSAEELGLLSAPSRRVRPLLPKRAYRLGPPAPAPPTPLAALVVLRPEPGQSEVAIEPLEGATKLHTLLAVRWYQRLVDPLGLSAAQFDLLTRVAASTPCVCLRRPVRGAATDLLAQIVEEAVT
jgi:hypothetical protein